MLRHHLSAAVGTELTENRVRRYKGDRTAHQRVTDWADTALDCSSLRGHMEQIVNLGVPRTDLGGTFAVALKAVMGRDESEVRPPG